MALVNEHFLKLPGSYLFSDIAKKVNTFKITHPKQDIIRLGIGDVTQPLPKACIEAMHKAVEELASKDTFRGYGPEQGYDFLIEAIIKNDFIPRGIHFSASEIFVSDGAKSDTGNIGDILRHDNSVGVTDPIYPVYIDSNVMCGRAGVLEEETGKWSNVTYMPCTSENNFIPEIPDKRIDIVYLCYPNNPTGTTLTKPELKKWVDYALANDTLILFDAAYEAYIQDENVPHSIYEIKGAKKCAIEFRSFSKTAGFTGADLENLLNEAAILAAKDNRVFLKQEDIKKAFVKVGIGAEKKSRVISEKEKRITAFHEAGHAILFHVLPDVGPVYSVSIIPTGSAGGYTMPLPEKDEMFNTKGKMLQDITVALGGRVAEEEVFDDITTGASQDIKQATGLAKSMVTKFGMSEAVGLINYDDDNNEVFIGRDLAHTARGYGEGVATVIDQEVKRIIDECYDRARHIIRKYDDVLHACADLLLEKEKISREEFEALFPEDVSED
jgi:histidinol-phosphate/aromatic aminotransferase/cobyric acid decarboxylase-like protein